jgi:NADH dehydrogenase [ubiquinone] 1 alpha subcomplex assembly factor 5
MEWQAFALPLVPQAGARHKHEMADSAPVIFDNRRRMAIRARAVARGLEQSFLLAAMADELAERLAYVSRNFKTVLLVGPIAVFADRILCERTPAVTINVMQDEEAFCYPPGSFDLVLSAGTLDSVNDLPGALVQLRRVLKPDGLFLGTLFGAGSLKTLKSAMLIADGELVRPHIHPQIDLRAISDLITRAGFALPVTDIDKLEVRYGDWRRLVRDLRDAGVSNALSSPRRFARSMPDALGAAWRSMSDLDGRVNESFHFLQLSGWAPAPSQPKPAARGSGTVSLASALKKS